MIMSDSNDIIRSSIPSSYQLHTLTLAFNFGWGVVAAFFLLCLDGGMLNMN